ncbi:hypothetical protein GCM10007276_05270 [Agaricicola taiwanensis]|uniref:Uncharacterized protein n=1 Tax=Agaricicola taiwanensis TaxID=591372 RepID=A0A8J2VLD2_9RHOB|nr:hypothetical protein GCM10007276_05270 [Agaricicola taiwanensis]
MGLSIDAVDNFTIVWAHTIWLANREVSMLDELLTDTAYRRRAAAKLPVRALGARRMAETGAT